MCMIVDDANKQSKWYILLVYTICREQHYRMLHTLTEVWRWGQMMPFGTAVIYSAKESCLQFDDPCLDATYTSCFLSVKL